ncbi:MAG: LysE family translocator, partial [Polaromonas sp.]
MTLTTYFLYLAAVALLVLSPGPTMLMCMTTALNHGPRKAMTSAAGSVSAVLCVMLLSALGLGALLAASETAFTVAKFMGAAYLIWLGVKTFRSDAAVLEAQPRERHQRSEGPPRASDGPRGAGARGSEPACAGLDGRQRRSVSRAAACKASGATRSARPWGQYFLRGFLVGASNPKAVLFFAAFFPQFLNPAAPFVPQFAILALT